MSQQKHHQQQVNQQFVNLKEEGEEVVSASELVRRWKKKEAAWRRRFLEEHPDIANIETRFSGTVQIKEHPEFSAICEEQGLHDNAREFARKHGSNDEGPINQQYLNLFPNLLPWEKDFARAFRDRSAYLPSLEGHLEVCKMTPSQRVEAGVFGIKSGEAHVRQFKMLKEWGQLGGG